MAQKVDQKENMTEKAKTDMASANSIVALKGVLDSLIQDVEDLKARLKKLEG